LERKERVMSVILDKYWIDIGTPKKYLEVHHDIMAGRFISKRVPASALDRSALPSDVSIDAKSILDTEVTVRSGVRIENSVIGKNCKIEEGAQIIDSVIWSGTTLDAGSVWKARRGKGCMLAGQ
jgi:NDP-sugar pyrophosphorylase family protein